MTAMTEALSTILVSMSLGLYRLGREAGGGDYHPAIRISSEVFLVWDNYSERPVKAKDPDRFQRAENWHSELEAKKWQDLITWHASVSDQGSSRPMGADTEICDDKLRLYWGYGEGAISAENLPAFVQEVDSGIDGATPLIISLGEVVAGVHI